MSPAGATATEPPVDSASPRLGDYLRVHRSIYYYALAAVVVVLVLYPVGVLFTASLFSGQPGRLGQFTLEGYRSWLTAYDLVPIFINSVIYASARLVLSLTLALLFAWAVARTNVPFRRTMMMLIPVPFFTPDLLTGISWLMLGNPAERPHQPVRQVVVRYPGAGDRSLRLDRPDLPLHPQHHGAHVPHAGGILLLDGFLL